MAIISNLQLSITKGTPGNMREVRVTYRINFTASERLAGTVFEERVTLRGSDLGVDDHLTTLRMDTVQAAATPPFVDRAITRMVSRDTLDEDRDFILAMRDEVYAQVRLEPFTPKDTQVDSNMVHGQFGDLGRD